MKVYNLLSLFFIVITLFLFSSCASKDNYESLFYSVFEINAGDSKDEIVSIGTGFKIDENYIVTNSHVISYRDIDSVIEYNYIEGKLYGSEEIIIFDIVFNCYEDDYVFLQPQKSYIDIFSNVSSLKLSKSGDFNIGDECYTIGNANNYGLALNYGIISSNIKKLTYKGNLNTFIQTSIEISKGSSGGPLFNKKQEVIGICTFKLRDNSFENVDGISFAIPISRINLI